MIKDATAGTQQMVVTKEDMATLGYTCDGEYPLAEMTYDDMKKYWPLDQAKMFRDKEIMLVKLANERSRHNLHTFLRNAVQ